MIVFGLLLDTALDSVEARLNKEKIALVA